MANRVLPGYVGVLKSKQEVVFDHDGPASYSNVVVNAGTGDMILTTDLGMPIDAIEVLNVDGLSSDGLNYCFAEYVNGGGGNAVPSVRLRWIVLATNAEVANGVNLSGKSIRIQVRFG